ncbi:FAD-dependent oxidoreductase [Klebsiella pneumoniae subsp. pneumoniae]|nr:FAD-dependent oxidoreductase [Klebsiella pneumoniae subsp. pneumoniae]
MGSHRRQRPAARVAERRELREREPNITGLGGIFVPSSGIVSYREVAAAMAKNFEAEGGTIVYNAEVSALKEHACGVVIRTRQGAEYEASTLIACSGLMADRLVKMLGVDPGFIIWSVPRRVFPAGAAAQPDRQPFDLSDPRSGDAVPRRPSDPSMIDGSVTVGPNAVLALEARRLPQARYLAGRYPGDPHLARHPPGTAKQPALRDWAKWKNSLCRSGYLRLVQKYCPSLTLSDLRPWPAGVRAQAVSPQGKLIDDFLFVTTARSIHTCNAPSPAATSAIPIGAHIVSKVQTLLASQSNPRTHAACGT